MVHACFKCDLRLKETAELYSAKDTFNFSPCAQVCDCLMLSKLKVFINRNEYLTALYMLITGQEVVCVTGVLRMLTVPHCFVTLRPKRKKKKKIHVYETQSSLCTLTQAVLEMIASLSSERPA